MIPDQDLSSPCLDTSCVGILYQKRSNTAARPLSHHTDRNEQRPKSCSETKAVTLAVVAPTSTIGNSRTDPFNSFPLRISVVSQRRLNFGRAPFLLLGLAVKMPHCSRLLYGPEDDPQLVGTSLYMSMLQFGMQHTDVLEALVAFSDLTSRRLFVADVN